MVCVAVRIRLAIQQGLQQAASIRFGGVLLMMGTDLAVIHNVDDLIELPAPAAF